MAINRDETNAQAKDAKFFWAGRLLDSTRRFAPQRVVATGSSRGVAHHDQLLEPNSLGALGALATSAILLSTKEQ